MAVLLVLALLVLAPLAPRALVSRPMVRPVSRPRLRVSRPRGCGRRSGRMQRFTEFGKRHGKRAARITRHDGRTDEYWAIFLYSCRKTPGRRQEGENTQNFVDSPHSLTQNLR